MKTLIAAKLANETVRLAQLEYVINQYDENQVRDFWNKVGMLKEDIAETIEIKGFEIHLNAKDVGWMLSPLIELFSIYGYSARPQYDMIEAGLFYAISWRNV